MVHEALDIASAYVHSFPSLPQPYETFTTDSPKQREQRAIQTEFMKPQGRDEIVTTEDHFARAIIIYASSI